VNVAARAQAMLFDPLTEWVEVEKESGDPAYLLSHYVAWLAAIPAVFSFVGAYLIGVTMPGGNVVHASLFDALFGAIFGYVLTCTTVLLLGLLIDLVAPVFGGRRDFDCSFKLAVYAFTPVWLAGVFLLLPGLRFLTLTGLYGAYILWLGLPRLMKTLEQPSRLFTLLVGACGFGLTYLSAFLQHMVFGTPGL
jgi:hypothetical protein